MKFHSRRPGAGTAVVADIDRSGILGDWRFLQAIYFWYGLEIVI